MGEKIITERVNLENGEFLKVVLGGKDYYLPFKVLGGKKVGFLDISGEVALIESCAEQLVDLLDENGVEFDTILNPVSKSNALAHSIAVKWAAKKNVDLSKTIVARKSGGGKITANYRSVTTDHEQTMSLTDDDAEYIKGKRVLVIDDVFGGGGTTKALMELVEKSGAIMAAHAVAAIEQGADIPDYLYYLFELPIGD